MRPKQSLLRIMILFCALVSSSYAATMTAISSSSAKTTATKTMDTPSEKGSSDTKSTGLSTGAKAVIGGAVGGGVGGGLIVGITATGVIMKGAATKKAAKAAADAYAAGLDEGTKSGALATQDALVEAAQKRLDEANQAWSEFVKENGLFNKTIKPGRTGYEQYQTLRKAANRAQQVLDDAKSAKNSTVGLMAGQEVTEETASNTGEDIVSSLF